MERSLYIVAKATKMRILAVIALLVFGFVLGRYSITFISSVTKRNESPIIPPIDFSMVYSGHYKIVVFGDSHVQRVSWNELLNRCDIAGRGLRKDNSEGYLRRIETVLKCRPEIVFLEVGSNDVEQDVQYADFISNVTRIIDTIKKQGARVVLFDICYVGKSYTECEEYNSKATAFNKGIDSIAMAINEPKVDLNDKLCSGGYLKSEYAQNDGIHHTPEAYLIWKSEIETVLKSLEK